MDTGGPRHLAFLLRLWQAGDAEDVTWRASLESAYTGERRAFGSLAALFAYLWAQTADSSGQHKPADGVAATPGGEPKGSPGAGPA